jgi:ribosome-binding protein aMBF1 (putative translation factor)
MTDPTTKPTPYAELTDVLANLPLLCRERRRQDGLSVRAAAEQIGISFSTVSRFENGEDANESTLAAVLRWLGNQEAP